MGHTTNFRVRAAVMAGLAAIVLPLTVAAGCEGGDDDSPGVEQNDDDGDDEDD
jgi:hypothetical protein